MSALLKQIGKWCCCCLVLAAINIPSCDPQAFEEATKSQLSSSLNSIFDTLVHTFVYNAFDLPDNSSY